MVLGMVKSWTYGRLKHALALLTVVILPLTWFFIMDGNLMPSPSAFSKDYEYQSASQEVNRTNSSGSQEVDDVMKGPGLFQAPASWLEEQKRRKDRVDNICRQHYRGLAIRTIILNKKSLLRTIIVDDEHKVLYCFAPKVACSSWKTVMTTLTGKIPDTANPLTLKVHEEGFLRRVGLRMLNRYPAPSIAARLKGYKKFFFVRNPFERLVSAHKDKFATPNKWNNFFQDRYGREMIGRFRPNASAQLLATGRNVTFEEFLNYIADDTIPERVKFNPHWQRYHSLCHPCVIDYDVIGKYETLLEDSNMILRLFFNVTDLSKFSFPKRHINPVPTRERMDEAYGQINPTLLRKIANLYQGDLRLFDYGDVSSILSNYKKPNSSSSSDSSTSSSRR